MVVGEPMVVGGLVRGGVVVDAEKGIALNCAVSGLVVGDARLLDADETPDEEEATELSLDCTVVVLEGAVGGCTLGWSPSDWVRSQ